MKKEIRELLIDSWIQILHSDKIIGRGQSESGATARKALKKLKVSPEEIERLIAEYAARDPAVEIAKLEAQVAAYSPPPISKGYTDGGKLAQVYVLECSHQIRAAKRVGLLSKGLIGKTVLCETCGASRKVVSAPYWVR
jgi:hypothetical protein